MSKIDLKKLQNAVQKDGKTIARCPACAAGGNDAKGEHLVIYPDGKFGCVAHPQDKKHNSLVLQIVGVDHSEPYQVPVKRVVHAPSKVIQVVGRFGRSLATAPAADATEPPASAKNPASPEAVPKPRPARPSDLTADVPVKESTPPPETKAARRPSSLDGFLASKGMTWQTSTPDKVPVSPTKKRQVGDAKADKL